MAAADVKWSVESAIGTVLDKRLYFPPKERWSKFKMTNCLCGLQHDSSSLFDICGEPSGSRLIRICKMVPAMSVYKKKRCTVTAF